MDSIDEVEWLDTKEAIREEKQPIIRISGGNRKRAILACEVQELTGG